MFAGLSSKAYDFQKDGIYYNINSDKKTVSVSKPEYSPYGDPYSGDIIPESVTDNNGKEYTVTAIDHHAFSNCTKVTSITLPNTITKILFEAFLDCTGLTSVQLSEGLKEISASAFNNCINLKEINIPSSVENIWANFSNCKSLPVIDGIRYADTYLIEVVDTLSTYTIKDGTRWIGTDAFKDCSFITNIEFPGGLTEIQGEAFYGCTGLTNIVLPNSVKILKEGVFAECTGLTEITIGTDLISITGDYGTFKNCTNLKTINFNAVRCQMEGKGWNSAFIGCNNMETINIGDSVRTIGKCLFGGYDNGFKIKNIYMGANVDTIGISAFYHCNFDTMFMHMANPPVLMDDKSLGTSSHIVVVPCGSAENYKNAQYYKNYNIIENCSGLTDINNNISISVYPNPTKETVTLNLENSTLDKNETVSIINNAGQVVYKSNITSQKTNINVSDLESGVYYVKVGEMKKKLIIE